AEWMRHNLSGLVVTLADPGAVTAAVDTGVGRRVRVDVGGKTDGRHGEPVPVDGYVKLLSDGAYRHLGTYNHGFLTRMGRTAVLEVAGNTVIVSERKAMPFDRQQLLSLGVDPTHHRALVVKSAVAWRAAFGEVAGEVIEVDTPGICTGNLSRLNYSEPRRRMLTQSGIARAGGRPAIRATAGRNDLSRARDRSHCRQWDIDPLSPEPGRPPTRRPGYRPGFGRTRGAAGRRSPTCTAPPRSGPRRPAAAAGRRS